MTMSHNMLKRLLIVGMATSTLSQASSADVGPQYLTGSWLGPAFGDTGRCGSAYAQIRFEPGSSFSYVQNTHDCGGVSGRGHYVADNHTIRLHFESCNTPTYCPPDTSEQYRLPDQGTL